MSDTSNLLPDEGWAEVLGLTNEEWKAVLKYVYNLPPPELSGIQVRPFLRASGDVNARRSCAAPRPTLAPEAPDAAE